MGITQSSNLLHSILFTCYIRPFSHFIWSNIKQSTQIVIGINMILYIFCPTAKATHTKDCFFSFKCFHILIHSSSFEKSHCCSSENKSQDELHCNLSFIYRHYHVLFVFVCTTYVYLHIYMFTFNFV